LKFYTIREFLTCTIAPSITSKSFTGSSQCEKKVTFTIIIAS